MHGAGSPTPPIGHVVLLSDFGTINGGSAKVALMSAKSLAEQGIPVDFIAGNGRPGEFLEGLATLNFHCLDLPPNSELPIKQRIGVAIWNPHVASEVERILAPLDRTTTVVHVHSYRDVLTVSAVRKALDLGFKVAFTVHDYRLGCPIGDFFDRQTQRICTLEGGSMACWTRQCTEGGWPEKLYQNFRHVRQQSLGGIPAGLKCVLFVSRFSQSKLTGYLPKDGTQHVVGNPIEFSQPPRRTLTDDSPLVFIGRLQSVKDPITAAKAAKKLGLPITFVGDGELRSEVLAAYPDAKITGWVGQEEVRRHLSTARALLFPSRWYEGQPLSTLEAVAYGVPVLCSETCAGSEVAEEYGAGVTFPAQDVDAIVERSRPILEPGRNEQISLSCYEKFWQDPPTLEKHARETLRIYRQLLAYP